MACFLIFVPFRVVAPDQVQQVLFSLNVGKAGKIIDITLAYLASVFHLTQSLLQQQIDCSQEFLAVPKQGLLPSTRWIVLISSLLDSLQVSLIPKVFAFFSTSESLTSPSFLDFIN
jgi:hypothetical protein